MSMLDFPCRARVLLFLAVASTVGTSLVPQCSKPPTTLQILFYGITPTTKNVCLLSGVTYFANLSVNGSADTFTSSPRTAAACAYNSSIYLNQSALNGTGSIAFQQSSSGNAFEVVYAPRGLYVNGKTVIAVTAGDLPPIDTIWLSYDISSWQVCELVNGTQLQPSFVIAAFDVEPKCLVSSIVSAGNIRAIRLAFNSSLVPIGNHTLVLIDGSYACGVAMASSSVSQPVILIVTQAASTQNNTTTDMPSSGNATMPTRIKPAIIAAIVVVITVMVIIVTVMVITVTVMVIVVVIKRRKDHQIHVGKNKPPLGQLELCSHLDGEAKPKIAPPTSLNENGPVEAQTRVMVVVEKNAEWVPLLSTKLCNLHKCNCDVVEFNDDIDSKIEDPRCQRVYAVCSTGPSSKPMAEFVAKLSPDVVANKLLLAHFGAPDKHVTSGQQAAISHPMQLEVGTVESCAAMLYEAHLGRGSKPPPLSIADVSDVIPDRSLSATPPGSATQLLEDSGRGSFTNSDQSTPDVQHRPKNIFQRDHSSLLISALAKARDIAEHTKEIKHNVNYLEDQGQKKLADECESIALPGPDAL